jgi:Holliday junction resolvase
MPGKIKTKVSDITSFLEKTGFILEMEIGEILKKKGYDVELGQDFLDLEENKKREIDIIAIKEINKIKVYLIIECKQSSYDDWIFICSDKKPKRYYRSVKHQPIINVRSLSKNNLFSHLHNFNSTIPLAQNYIAFQKEKGKKSDGLQIQECLMKLPKALVYVATEAEEGKSLFFPNRII